MMRCGGILSVMVFWVRLRLVWMVAGRRFSVCTVHGYTDCRSALFPKQLQEWLCGSSAQLALCPGPARFLLSQQCMCVHGTTGCVASFAQQKFQFLLSSGLSHCKVLPVSFPKQVLAAAVVMSQQGTAACGQCVSAVCSADKVKLTTSVQ